MSPFHQRTIAALSYWLRAIPCNEGWLNLIPFNHEARIGDAYDALEALRQEHREAIEQLVYAEEELAAKDNVITALETRLSEAAGNEAA